MLQLRISLISGMSPTLNSEIPPADRSEICGQQDFFLYGNGGALL